MNNQKNDKKEWARIFNEITFKGYIPKDLEELRKTHYEMPKLVRMG